ncbi:MAG: hypothetical protein IT429_14470 [Gemmataceae bacterium]|nr:hypothetical protein [Gemmataceae bacterium]
MTVAVPIKSLNLEQLADQIKPHFQAMDKAEQSALIHARDAGRWLKLAKARCRQESHPWNKWVPQNFNKTKQMADNYIRIFDRWPELEAEMAKTGRGLTIGEAIKLLGPQEKAANGEEQEAEPKAKRQVQLEDRQRETLQAYLVEKGVEIDPQAFWTALADLDINLKRIVNRLDILAQQLKEQELGQWLNSFRDGSPAWEDACQPYGLEPDVMAHAAHKAFLGVVVWHQADEDRPREDYDTLLAGNGWGWYYFVQGGTFRPAVAARKAAEWLTEHGAGDLEFELDEEQVEKLQEALAALPGPPTEPPAEDATAADPGPLDAVPPSEEPPTPSPKTRRR